MTKLLIQIFFNNTDTSDLPLPLTPWGRILKSKPVWALIFALIGNSWGYITIVSDMPKYLKSVLKVSIEMNGYLTSLPFVCMCIFGAITSVLADSLIASGKLSTTWVRKIGNSLASFGPGIFLVIAAHSGCNTTKVLLFLIIGQSLLGAATVSVLVNALDLAPNYAGSVMGLVNGISTLSGVFSPYVVGLLTPNQTVQEWRNVFWVVLFIFVVTNVIYLMSGSGELQKWNYTSEFSTTVKQSKDNQLKEKVKLLVVNK